MKSLINVQQLINKKVSLYLEIGRPSDAIRPILVFLLGYSIVTKTIKDPSLLWVSLSILFLSMHVVVYNDISDFKIDKKNRSNRPLQRSEISVPEAKKLCWFYFFASLMFISFKYSLIHYWCILFFLGFLYSNKKIRLSHKLVLAPIILILGNAILPLLMGSSLAKSSYLFVNQEVVTFLILLSVMFLSIGLYKDFKDIEGDKFDGKKTLFTLFKTKKVIKTGIILTFLSFIFFLYVMFSYEKFIFPIIFACSVLLLQISLLNTEKGVIKKRIPLFWLVYNGLIVYLISIFI